MTKKSAGIVEVELPFQLINFEMVIFKAAVFGSIFTLFIKTRPYDLILKKLFRIDWPKSKQKKHKLILYISINKLHFK